jgi:hypothetical protein
VPVTTRLRSYFQKLLNGFATGKRYFLYPIKPHYHQTRTLYSYYFPVSIDRRRYIVEPLSKIYYYSKYIEICWFPSQLSPGKIMKMEFLRLTFLNSQRNIFLKRVEHPTSLLMLLYPFPISQFPFCVY